MLDQNIVEIKRRYNDTFSVDWDLSNRCNYSCSYCSDFLHQPNAPLLTLKNFNFFLLLPIFFWIILLAMSVFEIKTSGHKNANLSNGPSLKLFNRLSFGKNLTQEILVVANLYVAK